MDDTRKSKIENEVETPPFECSYSFCLKEQQSPPFVKSESVVSTEVRKNIEPTALIRVLNTSCPRCGKEAKLLCTQCRSQKYCSQNCQLDHWLNGHKQVCQSILGRIIIVDVHDEKNSQAIVPNTHPVDAFILKVQVALNSKVSPMIGYDYSRSIYYLINSSNCKQSQLLERTIRTTGDVMGSKAYFNAKIRTRDNKLIIFLDQRHKNLAW